MLRCDLDGHRGLSRLSLEITGIGTGLRWCSRQFLQRLPAIYRLHLHDRNAGSPLSCAQYRVGSRFLQYIRHRFQLHGTSHARRLAGQGRVRICDSWSTVSIALYTQLKNSGTILAYFIMPESTGRSPAEIQELFEDRVPLRRWKGYKTGVERDMENYTGQVREP